jgi:hypothetical protein
MVELEEGVIPVSTIERISRPKSFIPTNLGRLGINIGHRVYNNSAIDHFFTPKDDLLQVVALEPGTIDFGKEKSLGVGRLIQLGRPELVSANGISRTVRRPRSGLSVIVAGENTPEGVAQTRYVTVHEIGHALGLTTLRPTSRRDNHCENVCVMGQPPGLNAFSELNFLFEHAAPFCQPCADYLRQI